MRSETNIIDITCVIEQLLIYRCWMTKIKIGVDEHSILLLLCKQIVPTERFVTSSYLSILLLLLRFL